MQVHASDASAPKDHQMTLNTKRSRYPIYMLQLPAASPKFQSFLLYGQLFLSYRPFWDKCTEWPKMTLNTKRSKVPIYVLKLLPSLKFHPVFFFLYGNAFSSYRPFWDKYTEWPKKWPLNTKRSKVLHIHVTMWHCTTTPGSQISPRFTLWLAISKYWQFFICPLATMINFNLFLKWNLKFQNSKKQLLCGLLQETCRKRIKNVGGEIFSPIGSNVNENFILLLKMPRSQFREDYHRNYLEKVCLK